MNEDRIKEIGARLSAVEQERPGRWFIALGSGNNVCTAIFAELIGPRLDEDGNKIEKPRLCPYRDDPELYKDRSKVQCKRHPMLRWVKLCADPEEFPVECPLEPSRVDTVFVCDFLPDYILKEYPTIPGHGALLKFFESVKDDLHFLIGEVKRLKETRLRDNRVFEALKDLVAVIETDQLMPPSLSYFAEAKKIIEERGVGS